MRSRDRLDRFRAVSRRAALAKLKKTEAAALRKELELPDKVEAPVAAGQALGRLRLLDGEGRELLCLPVVAPAEVPRLSWGRVFLLCLRALVTGCVP